MAVYSGNLLWKSGDDGYFWTLALIVSNLFELIGEGEKATDRFLDGYSKIMGPQEKLVYGWQATCVARSIRNLLVHELVSDRKQWKNDEKSYCIKHRFYPYLRNRR